MSTTRRSLLRGLAAVPLATLPAVPIAAVAAAAEPDPTFALIAAHRAAYAALQAVPGDFEGDEPELAAEDAALIALVEREPTTFAGLRAFAVYFDTYAPRHDFRVAGWALATISEACRRLIPAEDRS